MAGDRKAVENDSCVHPLSFVNGCCCACLQEALRGEDGSSSFRIPEKDAVKLAEPQCVKLRLCGGERLLFDRWRRDVVTNKVCALPGEV